MWDNQFAVCLMGLTSVVKLMSYKKYGYMFRLDIGACSGHSNIYTHLRIGY